MRQVQLRFRIGLLCALGLLADNTWAQGDLSQMSYTGLIYTVIDESNGVGHCSVEGSYLITPWSSVRYGSEPTWSPDGAQIAFTKGADIFATSPGIPETRLTSTHNNWNPAWAPDGRQIAFVSFSDGPLEIYVMGPAGSDVVRLTYGVASKVGRPAWSPDSRRIAFNCEVDAGNQDICAINRDGSGFTRLTADPAMDADAAWSPDGSEIVFSTTRFDGATGFALMTPDGSYVAPLGSGIAGSHPAWSPDGTRIAFYGLAPDFAPDRPKYGIYTVAPDGTSGAFLGGGTNFNPDGGYACDGNAGPAYDAGAIDPAWMPKVPVAIIDYQCTELICSFNGLRSLDGYATISRYSWDFGDGHTAEGPSAIHSYATAGTYPVSLTVTNTNLVSGSGVRSVTVPFLPPPPPNIAPSVALISPVSGGSFADPATVSVAATASDPDGTISSVRFYVGNTLIGTATVAPFAIPSAITLARGTYLLTAIATDNGGLTTTSAGVTIDVLTPPLASFTSACVGLTCTFDASSSKGDSNSYSWDFGDGIGASPSSSGVITHTYSHAGNYVVTLRVTNAVGANTTSHDVAVVRRMGGR